jgi:Carboxypeptidase regulatory-like domain
VLASACLAPHPAERRTPSPGAGVARTTDTAVYVVPATDTLTVADTAFGVDTVVPAGAPTSERKEDWTRLTGRVTLAGSGAPLPGVWVNTGPFGGETDSLGRYTVDRVEPGRVEVLFERRGYVEERRTYTAKSKRTDTMDVVLRLGQRACCQLSGRWSVRLDVDTPGIAARTMRSRTALGTLRFGPEYPDPFAEVREAAQADTLNPVKDEFGRFDIDLAVFFGGPYGRDVSTTVFGGADSTLFKEAAGAVFDGDSAEVHLIPRMSHGGIYMAGRVRNDTITGRWWQAAYCCGAMGRFVMVRDRGAGR